jgi:hypothetical protein
MRGDAMKWLIGCIGTIGILLIIWALSVTRNDDGSTSANGPASLAFWPGLLVLAFDMALFVFWGLWKLFTT